MTEIVISGTGLVHAQGRPSVMRNWSNPSTPTSSFTTRNNAEAIAAGDMPPLQPSSAEFIEKASGIKSRYRDEQGRHPRPAADDAQSADRPNEAQSVQCEMAVAAAAEAMEQAGKRREDIDAVIVAASNMQRAYPAMAVEIQDALGITGFGFDMNVACSSATFGIQQARDTVATGSAKCVLMLNPEICSGHLNFRDRDSHFIFGDVCTAVIVEQAATADLCRPIHYRGQQAADHLLQQYPQQLRLSQPL